MKIILSRPRCFTYLSPLTLLPSPAFSPMRHLRRKLTLRAHDDQIVLVKRKQERVEHVWMKAFLWALYLPDYPTLSVEVSVDDRYKPDVVSTDRQRGRPQFWGEAGHVGPDKIEDLLPRYPGTHFAVAKWNRSLNRTQDLVDPALRNASRSAPVDLIRFPPDSADRFIDEKGQISISADHLQRRRIPAESF
ncbi:MAG: hypothetical protein BRD55_10800 [Bacteroidetes bacterium SW_9_63_38]|nr:MAG: hypothetical protein BRD55_10800 [Bacteroidetes bacterium SW_9_63_38]